MLDVGVERGRVRKGIQRDHIPWLLLPQDLLDRDLELLPGPVARDHRDLDHLVGHVPRGKSPPEGFPDGPGQRVIQGHPGRHNDIENELAVASRRVLEVDDKAVFDSRHLLDHRVELSGAEPHPATIERGIGTARDDAASRAAEPDPVAMTPDAGDFFEIRGAVAAAVLITPNPTSIDSMGAGMTSSPTSTTTGRPAASNA